MIETDMEQARTFTLAAQLDETEKETVQLLKNHFKSKFGVGVISSTALIRAALAALLEKENLITGALTASDQLIEKAQTILSQFLESKSNHDANQTIQALLGLLDGPEQREIKEATRRAAQ